MGFKKIFREEKGLLFLMILLFISGVFLIIHTLLHYRTGGSAMYVGYSDIGAFADGEFLSLWSSGGYRTGDWAEMAAFPIVGGLLAIFHNIFAVQIYNRRGRGYAQLFVLVSIFMAVVVSVVLFRLLKTVK